MAHLSPMHVLENAGDRRVACGLKSQDVAVGLCLWVDAHRAHYDFDICEKCAVAFDRPDWLEREVDVSYTALAWEIMNPEGWWEAHISAVTVG